MLTYKNLAIKSFNKMKDKRILLGALIMFIPSFINVIVSSILLSDLSEQLVKVFDQLNELILDNSAVITSEIINGYTNQIIDALIANISSIIISVVVSILIFIISSLLLYLIYYIVYMVENKEKIDVKILFSHLPGGIWLSILYTVKIFLWSLLFIIPGIVKSYSYALCFYIKIENPYMKSSDCIKKSKELMNGRKERLFVQSLLFGLINIIASFIISSVLSLVYYLPLGNFIYSVLESYCYYILTIYWYMNVAVYYEEVKKDEKYLDEHPDLREKGITGKIEQEKPRMHFSYGPNPFYKDPFKKEEKNKVYDANPFSEENKNKKEDPFED